MYDFNLLVSCRWGTYKRAGREIARVLRALGDAEPAIRRTAAEGIIGVKTRLDARQVIHKLREIFEEDPLALRHTLKWVPVDIWTASDIDSMKETVIELRGMIREGERWRATVEKRRYTSHHKIEIIEALAELIDEKVDLRRPNKILRVDIIGKYAGISVLTPRDVLSTTKPSLF